MANCIGASRERFEKELKRGRYVGRMIVVIEGSLADVCAASRGISHNAIVGTLPPGPCVTAPLFSAGSQQEAADFAFRLLAAQVRGAKRMANAISLTGLHLTRPLKSPWRASWRKNEPLPRIGEKLNLEAMTDHPEETHANAKKPPTRKVRPTRGERNDGSGRIYASGV